MKNSRRVDTKLEDFTNHLVELFDFGVSQVKPQNISSYELDNLLERYYLNTEIPTLDYVYSLCALGASSPQDLQTILESSTKEKLLKECEKMLQM